MADIDTYLSNILSAVYGEQVRGSIHDAIEAINTVVSNWETGIMDDTLTSESLPAQSKAVGDRVTNLYNQLSEPYKNIATTLTVYNGYYASGNGAYNADSRYKCCKVSTTGALPIMFGATELPIRYVFMLNGSRVASYTTLPDLSTVPAYDEIRMNFNASAIADGISMVNDESLHNTYQYPQRLTAAYITQMAWETIADLPTNYLYQISSDVPESFGLHSTGNASLIVLQPTARAMSSSWGRLFINIFGQEVWIRTGQSQWSSLMVGSQIANLANSISMEHEAAAVPVTVYNGYYGKQNGVFNRSDAWRCFKVTCRKTLPYIYGTELSPDRYILMLDGVYQGAYTPANLPAELPDFDEVRINYNTTSFEDGDISVYVIGADKSSMQYPKLITAAVITQNEWETIADLPVNYLYQMHTDVPASFGLKMTGAKSTLVVLQATKNDEPSTWGKMYVNYGGTSIYVKTDSSSWNSLGVQDAIDDLDGRVDALEAVSGTKGINVLFLGNSYAYDEVGYLPGLVKEAFPGMRCNFGIAFRGAGTLQQHYNYLTSGSEYAGYFEYDWDNNRWAGFGATQTVNDILARHEWDVISFQQGSASSDDYSTYQPYLNYLINGYSERIGRNVKFVFMLTHAWGANDPRLTDKSMTSDEMYAAIATAVQAAYNGSGISEVLPTGTAIQNLRKIPGMDQIGAYGYLCYDSSSHLQNGIPALPAAYVLFLKVCEWMGKSGTGIFGSGIIPTQDWTVVQNVPDRNGTAQGATAENVLIAAKCAMAAIKNPFEITDCSDM